MHRFALVPLDAVCAGDHLGRRIRREVDHVRTPEQPTVSTAHDIPYFSWSV
jgi:hypothetical protein